MHSLWAEFRLLSAAMSKTRDDHRARVTEGPGSVVASLCGRSRGLFCKVTARLDRLNGRDWRIADTAGNALGSTRSRMTLNRHERPNFV